MRRPREEADNERAMTFTEIGRRLGMNQQTAMWHYGKAMEKLRRDPAIFTEFRNLVALHRSAIDRREGAKRVFQDNPRDMS
jgi:hypothetical protein